MTARTHDASTLWILLVSSGADRRRRNALPRPSPDQSPFAPTALAARRTGLSAGLAISAVSFFGLFPRAPAPLLTGLIADALSLPAAFFMLSLCMAAALAGVAVFVPGAKTVFKKPIASGGIAK